MFWMHYPPLVVFAPQPPSNWSMLKQVFVCFCKLFGKLIVVFHTLVNELGDSFQLANLQGLQACCYQACCYWACRYQTFCYWAFCYQARHCYFPFCCILGCILAAFSSGEKMTKAQNDINLPPSLQWHISGTAVKLCNKHCFDFLSLQILWEFWPR